MNMWLTLLTAVAGLSLAAPQETERPEPGTLHLEPLDREVRTAEGRKLEVERGTLVVLEDRARPEGAVIQLTFARLKSTSEEPGPPLVYLHGGPGGSATGNVLRPESMSLWSRFLEFGDVILLDQRGCGRSEPALQLAVSTPPPKNVFESRAAFARYAAEAGRMVRDKLLEEGIDYTAYTTEASADDVDDLRRALGAERVRLFGFSYGTHLGLSVLRRHGAHVERAILVGVEGPDETVKLPSNYDAHIARLAAIVEDSPDVMDDVPDFAGLLREVLEQLEREPMEVELRQPVSRRRVRVPIGREGLARILVRDFGDTSDLIVFPRLLYSIQEGDPSVLQWFAQKRYGVGAYPTLAFTMDPASGCSAERARRVEREARACVLGEAMNYTFPEVEDVWRMPRLPDAFRAPLRSEVPTLFLSGELDANTPPSQAENICREFVRGTHLVSAFGGHEDFFRNEKAQAAALDFMRGEDVAGRDVDMPPLEFIPVEGEPYSATHPSLE